MSTVKGQSTKSDAKKKNIFHKFAAIKQNTREDFVYFIGFLYAISTGEVEPVELIHSAKNSGYGYYAYVFKGIYRLGVGWGYGVAKSCDMTSSRVRKSEGDLKQFLIQLGQVINLGESLYKFFKGEFSVVLSEYIRKYEQKLESHKLFLELFYTIMSTSSLMVASNSIMTMLMGGSTSANLLVYSTAAILVAMSGFVVLMHVLFSSDKFIRKDFDMSRLNLITMVTIGMTIVLGLVFFVTNIIPIPLAVGVMVVPLFIPGILSMKIESRIQSINTWYPDMIRHFGQIYATVGSVSDALETVLRSDFGPLTKHVRSLKRRIKNRIRIEDSFKLFSKESGSETITSGNTIVMTTIARGGKMDVVGVMLSELTVHLNELREKRRLGAKTFETVVIILHALTMAVFGLLAEIMSIFYTIISSIKLANNAIAITPIDPTVMNQMIPILILASALINALAIKIAQGGLFRTVFFNFALLALIGGVAEYGTTQLLHMFLQDNLLQTVSSLSDSSTSQFSPANLSNP